MRWTLLHSYLLWRSSVPPDAATLAKRRLTISASLLPALLVGLFFYGWYAGLVVLAAVLGALATDLITHRFNGRFILNNPYGTEDGLWLATGLIVGLLFPPAFPLWCAFLGGVIAILAGKHWLSVDGMPLLQPAAVALLALHALSFALPMHPSDAGKPAWPVLVRQITKPAEGEAPAGRHLRDFFGGDIRNALSKEAYNEQLFTHNRQPFVDEAQTVPAEAIYGPRPLDLVQLHSDKDIEEVKGEFYYDRWSLLLGGVPGSIGGGQGLALLCGILLLVFSGTVSWILPLCALATLGLTLKIFGSPNVTYHLFSGCTLLGFFYLAASPTTCPRSKRGMILAGIAVGLLEALLRQLTPLAEATFLSAIAIQGISILFDQYLAPPKEIPARSDSGFGLPTVRFR
ncbi:MAG: RnfABCDGE type electron transport complex subunit D [Planctomycetes bacterium]|nr:RnfABCDGE type electron transport complex subunit D [Planctomycetota bacterium]